jgi:hypothetical protein
MQAYRASGQRTAKPISIRGIAGKSSGCTRWVAELASGDLSFVRKLRLRMERSILTRRQTSFYASRPMKGVQA